MIFKIYKNDSSYDTVVTRNVMGKVVKVHHDDCSYYIRCYRNWFAWFFNIGKFLSITPGTDSPYRVKFVRPQYKAVVYKTEADARRVIDDMLTNPDNYLVY
jgi:hypothetical protein